MHQRRQQCILSFKDFLQNLLQKTLMFYLSFIKNWDIKNDSFPQNSETQFMDNSTKLPMHV